MTEKRCSRCGRVLPLTEFYRTRRSPDGRHWQCKDCKKEQARAAYESGRYLEQRVRECESDPRPKLARLCVRLALNAGVLTRPDHCSGCGCPDTVRRWLADGRIEGDRFMGRWYVNEDAEPPEPTAYGRPRGSHVNRTRKVEKGRFGQLASQILVKPT